MQASDTKKNNICSTRKTVGIRKSKSGKHKHYDLLTVCSLQNLRQVKSMEPKQTEEKRLSLPNDESVAFDLKIDSV